MTKVERVTYSTSPLFGSLHTTRLIARNYGRDNCLWRRSFAQRLLKIAVIAIIPLVVVSCGGGSHPGPRGTPPSNLSYPQSAINATVGAAIPAEAPTVTGTVSSYSCSPALPTGLVLDTSAGTISGKPTAVSATATYNINASNSSGSTATSIQITVNAAVLASAAGLSAGFNGS